MFENVRVRDWMTSPVYTVLPDTPISVAHKIMTDNNIRRLPVIGTHEVVGIVTLGDIREAAPSTASTLTPWERKYLWSLLSVSRVMSTRVLMVKPSDPILNVVDLMMNFKVSGLPVVDDKTLVGIITESDIFRMMVKLSVAVVS